MTTSARVIGDL